MSTYKKIFIGGLGALTPIILNLLVIELEVLLLKLTLFAVIGYLIRVIVLFYLGGLMAFLHKDENNPIKIFELGIVAPALITAMLNAGQIDVPRMKGQAENRPVSFNLLIPAAQAQTATARNDSANIAVKTFSMPQETPIQQIWRGLIGSRPRRLWFVIVGSHLKLEDAQKQAEQIRNMNKDFSPEVYAPYLDSKYYSVVIGANLTLVEARQLMKKAVDAGLPTDAYLWTFPRQ
ncbi:MAG: hypothetical protein ONB16_06515 [candidate division KSB1 bacterium]|nr:hypothetical protein [candidate division KSB1 bacterium]MDZ7319354.1 hypothetical protein [candidate division KSB1 bacterium]MDZ7340760.1 hypothetical protein [candidate division KSB1 bacterium]